MNARLTVIAATLLSVLVSNVVFADDDEHEDRHKGRGHDRGHRQHHEHDYIRSEIVYAPVIYVEPMYQVVQRARPRRECWSTTDSYRSEGDGGAGLVLGGVLGGVVGHNIARGRDNDAVVIAGTLLGATIGHDLGHTQVAPVTRTHCESSNDYDEREEIIGYRVKYRYFGRVYETQTDRHPGPRVRVSVSLED